MEKTIKISDETLQLINRVCSLALQTGRLESAPLVTMLQNNLAMAIQQAEKETNEKIEKEAATKDELKLQKIV